MQDPVPCYALGPGYLLFALTSSNTAVCIDLANSKRKVLFTW